MPDPNKEIIIMEQVAMYLTALPCPPLPMKVRLVPSSSSAGGGEDDEEACTVISSHEVLMVALIEAMRQNNRELNLKRKDMQLQLTDKLICALEQAADVQAAFDACQRFTAEYILAFDDPERPGPNVQLMPMDHVEKRDKVHLATCSWHAAQDIQHMVDTSQRRTAAQFATMTYSELIQEHMHRVKMTTCATGEGRSDI